MQKTSFGENSNWSFYNFLKIFQAVLSLIDHAVLKNVDFYHLEPVTCEELRTPRDQRFHTDSPAIEHSSGRWERKQVDQSEDIFFLHWGVLPSVLYFFILIICRDWMCRDVKNLHVRPQRPGSSGRISGGHIIYDVADDVRDVLM